MKMKALVVSWLLAALTLSKLTPLTSFGGINLRAAGSPLTNQNEGRTEGRARDPAIEDRGMNIASLVAADRPSTRPVEGTTELPAPVTAKRGTTENFSSSLPANKRHKKSPVSQGTPMVRTSVDVAIGGKHFKAVNGDGNA